MHSLTYAVIPLLVKLKGWGWQGLNYRPHNDRSFDTMSRRHEPTLVKVYAELKAHGGFHIISPENSA